MEAGPEETLAEAELSVELEDWIELQAAAEETEQQAGAAGAAATSYVSYIEAKMQAAAEAEQSWRQMCGPALVAAEAELEADPEWEALGRRHRSSS